MTIARPTRAGMCVCRHEMWIAGFPALSRITYGPRSEDVLDFHYTNRPVQTRV